MMKLYKYLICSICLMAATQSYGQQAPNDSSWEKYISLKNYLTPFWKADTIYEEITQVIKNGSIASGSLWFNAQEIIAVKSADLKTIFEKDKDWKYEEGKLSILPNSKIPFLTKEELVFTTDRPGWSMTGKKEGTYVLFSESNYFRSMQISVTYVPVKDKKWDGPVPVFARKNLPLSIKKLLGKKDLKVVFFGNSIETGANSSAYQNEAPFMPSWPDLIVYNLQQHYGGKITFSNQSVGGMLAQWGQDKATEAVAPENPGLVIIGFGMNDGSAGVPPEKYRNNIQSIMDSVRAKNKKAEFILIAPMLANPFAIQSNIQALYKSELDKLAKKGVVVADITSVHEALLKHKSYQDMTGNNVNHPNDYLARWYAQFISGLLIK